MTRLLVTGADGFVGRWLVRAARAAGHQVIASILPEASPPTEWQATAAASPVEVVWADMREVDDLVRLAELEADAVVHLAAIASGHAARQDPEAAYQVNAAMTLLLAAELARRNRPRFLLISSAEVYGPGHDGPIAESEPMNPRSPYGLSKAGAEGARNLWPEAGLPVVIARAFPHTGPGQGTAYVLPALVARLKAAKAAGERVVKAGNLAVVRDFLDVRDVVRAYLLLLEHGVPGEAYNVASGTGRRLADCFDTLARLVGVAAVAEQDASLLRPGDIAVLIGDSTKLRHATGWSPQIPFERTLQEMVDAQAD